MYIGGNSGGGKNYLFVEKFELIRVQGLKCGMASIM